MKAIHYVTSCCAIALCVTAAKAQDTDAASASPSAGIEDIVVTAQRRSERLQDTPVSVTAANAELLSNARVTSGDKLVNLSPSISVTSTSNPASSTNIQIRGIGTAGTGRSFEGAVGMFVDGVYRSRGGQALQTFLDIDNLQILRGPQGTLFGKNTSAGALLLTSTNPDLSAVRAQGEATYGNYDYYSLRAAVSAPLSEKVAVRVAGITTKRNGYVSDANSDDTYQNVNTQGVKLQVLAEPTETLKIRLIGDYITDKSNCCFGVVNVQAGSSRAVTNDLIVARGLKLPSSDPDDYETTLTRPSHQRIKDYGGTALIDWEIGSGTLHSITAARRYIVDAKNIEGDFVAAELLDLNQYFKSKFFSQELVYNGELEGLGAEYLFGGYYSNEDITITRQLFWGSQAQQFWQARLPLSFGAFDASAGQLNDELFKNSNRSTALFTHWEFPLNDTLTLIAGARYSWERKRGTYTYDYLRTNADDLFRRLNTYPGPAYDVVNKDKAFSGTAGIRYRPSSNAMFYATYNRGFKAGGVALDQNAAGGVSNNPAEVPGAVVLNPRYKPEKTDAYEIGAKFDYLDGRARTNIAIFYSKITDLQVAQFLGIQFVTLNAPGAKVRGAEVETSFKPIESITLGLQGTYLPKANFSASPTIGILSNRRFVNSPKFAGQANIDLDQPVSSDLAVTGRLQVQYTGKMFTATTNNFTRNEMALVNANIGLKSIGSGWQVEGWVQNLFDKRYITDHILTPLQAAGDIGGYVGAPRTYGLTVKGSF